MKNKDVETFLYSFIYLFIHLFSKALALTIRTGSLPLGIMRRIKRLSYFSSSFLATIPCECDGKSKTLIKLTSTRVFIVVEPWMVRAS